MTSSKNPKNPTNPTDSDKPEHPQVTVESMINKLAPLANTDDQRCAIRSIVRLALPASNIKELVRVSTILYVSRLIDRDVHRSFYRTVSRVLNNTNFESPRSLKHYPYFYAIRILYEAGRQHSLDGVNAVRYFVRLGNSWPKNSQYSATMYYKHSTAFRHVCLEYWRRLSSSSPQRTITKECFSVRLLVFVRTQLLSKGISRAFRRNLLLTEGLLDGTLMLGGAIPRSKVFGRKSHDIDSNVSPSSALLDSITGTTILNSAIVECQWLDDAGIHARINYPPRSTTKDRHRIDGHVRNGFARTNVRTTADMSSCSLVTHRDYLVQAAAALDDASYSLIWLVAFTGIDFLRPIRPQFNPDTVPENDEILVSVVDTSVQYKVLRRYQRDDPSKYRSCGIFKLPVPNRVASGLTEIANLGTQFSCVDAGNRFAKKYSVSNSGLTPTLNRLRSGARTHFVPLGLTELDFAVVSGRVPPAIKAISSYYPHSSLEVANKFSKTYQTACSSWILPKALRCDFPRQVVRRRDAVLCKPADAIDALDNVLGSIAKQYSTYCRSVVDHIGRIDIDKLLAAVNLHELACYSLQELGVGLRPTGKRARFVAVNPMLGAMTADKASRLFSERSYSPITKPHWQLLQTCRLNRAELAKQLRYVGKHLVLAEASSDLAIVVEKATRNSMVSGIRMTGSRFRQSLSMVPGILDYRPRTNWLRHFVADCIGGNVPQWQADEFLAHRRVGREPLGRWSTAGPANLQDVRQLLTDLHTRILPEILFVPILGHIPIGRSSQDAA